MIQIGELLRKLWSLRSCFLILPPRDWRCDEAWLEQTLEYPPVMCQQKLIYYTWDLNVMHKCFWNSPVLKNITQTSYPCIVNLFWKIIFVGSIVDHQISTLTCFHVTCKNFQQCIWVYVWEQNEIAVNLYQNWKGINGMGNHVVYV